MSKPTPEQLDQLVEIMQTQAELSEASGCNQEITIVFKNGHLRWINASNNANAVMILDELPTASGKKQ